MGKITTVQGKDITILIEIPRDIHPLWTVKRGIALHFYIGHFIHIVEKVAKFMGDDEVEKKIGDFKYKCFPVVNQADGFTYFDCAYDLRGDEEFFIVITFTYPDKAVFSIHMPMGYDGE